MTVGDGETGLLGAVLKVQAKLPTMPKDRKVKVQTKSGGEYEYSYTPLDTIVERVGPPLLAENGLVWMTFPRRSANGELVLRYRLSHAATGEVLEDEIPLMLEHQDAQGLGSAITYARRYALCAVLNIVGDADDDGQLAGASRPRELRGEATDKQRAAIRYAIKKNGLNEHEARRVFKGARVPLADDVKVNEVIDTLTKQQASALLDLFNQGTLPTGESDVPSDLPFFSEGDAK
jgi:hypothetical protein